MYTVYYFMVYLFISMSCTIHSMEKKPEKRKQRENFDWLFEERKKLKKELEPLTSSSNASKLFDEFIINMSGKTNYALLHTPQYSAVKQIIPFLSDEDINKKIAYTDNKTALQLLTLMIINGQKKFPETKKRITSLIELLMQAGADPYLKDRTDASDQSFVELVNSMSDFYLKKRLTKLIETSKHCLHMQTLHGSFKEFGKILAETAPSNVQK